MNIQYELQVHIIVSCNYTMTKTPNVTHFYIPLYQFRFSFLLVVFFCPRLSQLYTNGFTKEPDLQKKFCKLVTLLNWKLVTNIHVSLIPQQHSVCCAVLSLFTDNPCFMKKNSGRINASTKLYYKPTILQFLLQFNDPTPENESILERKSLIKSKSQKHPLTNWNDFVTWYAIPDIIRKLYSKNSHTSFSPSSCKGSIENYGQEKNYEFFTIIKV